MTKTILTGIKPTGTAHIGNYFGAIKPAIDLANSEDAQCFYFIADYHAMTTVKNKQELKDNSFKIACIWLACGLDPNKVTLYRQSDVPQVCELSWILSCVTPKGLLNRAHAYKNIVEKNKECGSEEDDGVNMGIFNYPILMASDIVLLNSNSVPVGKDQLQHIEIARDIVKVFNKTFGNTLVMPNAIVEKQQATILGTDGRKMSKSYGNIIPIICEPNQLQKLIARIVTDSSLPNQPKDTNCTIFNLYKLFASEQEIVGFENEFKKGISWADAKKTLFEKMNSVFQPIREKYSYYVNNPQIVEQILLKGAQKVKPIAEDTIKRVKLAVGLA